MVENYKGGKKDTIVKRPQDGISQKGKDTIKGQGGSKQNPPMKQG